jgi:hypothetical protein
MAVLSDCVLAVNKGILPNKATLYMQ